MWFFWTKFGNCKFFYPNFFAWVDESPKFIAPIENEIFVTEGITEVVSLVAADFNGNEINSFSLSGPDKDLFMIEDNNLKFKTPVDFETQSTYSVNIIAVDKFGNSATKLLTINVDNGKKYHFFLEGRIFLFQNKLFFRQSSLIFPHLFYFIFINQLTFFPNV